MPENVFVYGTLMEPRIITEVIGRTPEGHPAVLRGYRRSCLEGELYPGIQPDESAQIEGLVYPNLAPDEVQSLDRFEGDLYQRSTVTVSPSHAEPVQVEVYVIRPEHRHHLTGEAWDFKAFRERFVERFAAQYRGFGR